MGSLFEVHVPTLSAGSGWLHTDSGDVSAAGTAASGGAGAARGACGGGPLAGALARLSSRLDGQVAGLSTAVGDGGDTLAGNAATYTGEDGAAAGGLGAVGFSGAW